MKVNEKIRLLLPSFFMLCMFLMHAGFINAQGFDVKGTVKNGAGDPMPGVNIIIKGTDQGTLTANTGEYTIGTKTGDVLQFFFMGYVTEERTVGTATVIDMIMTEETETLGDVVVVGYGVQAKKDITGSVSVVNTKELLSTTGSSAAQQLQGRASGVYVGQSGSPGSATMVRIRGINTVNDNGPLYVIDGVSTRGQNLNAFSPNDIESMQILKDASASAIYGAQAANGVILITTKRGSKTGKPTLSYDGYYGIQKTTSRYDVLNSRDRIELEWKAKAYSNSLTEGGDPSHIQFGTGPSPKIPNLLTVGGAQGRTDIDPSSYSYPNNVFAPFSDTDWWDEVDQIGSRQNHQLTLTGGNESGQYLMSANLYDEKGTQIESYYKRYIVRANTSFNVRPWLRIGENMSYMWSKDLGLSTGTGEATLYSWSYRASPYVPVRDIQGNYAGSKFGGTGNWQNPVANAERSRDNYWTNARLFGNLWAEIDLMKNLTFRTSYGLDWTNHYHYRMNKPNLEFSESQGDVDFEEQNDFNFRWVFTNTLTYNLKANKHALTVLLGTEAIKDGIGRGVRGRRFNYLFPDDVNTWTLDLGENNNRRETSSWYVGEFALMGYFARADYAFADKYLLTAIVRRDGVSRFSPSNRCGTFPSISAGWRISQEGFMEGTKDWLSDMKLRMGWGLTGNSEMPRTTNFAYEFYSDPVTTNYDMGGQNTGAFTGYRLRRYGNPDTKWEATNMVNVGLDVALFKNKVNVNFEYWNKKTTDMLIQAAYSAFAAGADAPYINYGSIQNKGWDFSIGYNNRKGDWGWDVSLNLSHYKNEVLKLAAADDYAITRGGTRLSSNFLYTTKGHPISEFYGYNIIGFYESVDDVLKSPLPLGINSRDELTKDNNQLAKTYVGKFKYDNNGVKLLDDDGNPVKDDNGKDIERVSTASRQFIGSPHPDLIAGLNLGITYKNWDFSAFFYSTIGNKLFNNTKYFTDFWLFEGNRSSRMRDKSWEPGKKDAILPILDYTDPIAGNDPSSYYVENASFLKLKNLVLGYTIPTTALQKLGIQRLRLYLQGENLFTITKYTGLDPELTNNDVGAGNNADLQRGLDMGGWPTTLKLTFGVNFVF